jgi:hypothetical protein
MYLVVLKSALVEALRATFDEGYPDPDFRNLRVSPEYPIGEQDYPGLWVQYEDTDELQIAGIGHIEIVRLPDGREAPTTRWRFGGTVTITCVALTSLERDRLYDGVVRTLAFAKVNQGVSEFRRLVENNDFVGMNGNFDQLRASGDAASQGTPWGTDEVIYEKSISFDLIGEFVSEPEFGDLVNLRLIITKGYIEGYREPLFTGQDPSEVEGYDPAAPQAGIEVHSPWNEPGSWH